MTTTAKVIMGVILVVSVGLLAGCSMTKPKTPTTIDQSNTDGGAMPTGTDVDVPFLNTIWTATTIDNQAAVTGTTITTQFGSDGRVSGSDGCNTFSTAYSMDDSNLTIDPNMVSTKMACSKEVMSQAEAFTQALVATTRYDLSGGMLTLYQGNTAGLEFVGRSNSDNVSNTSWNVTGYNNGKQAVVSPIMDTSLTITFGADGTISGNAGCNSYSGQYSVEDQSISISQLATTMRACADEGVSEQESTFLAALQTAATWQIQGNQLSLRTADDALAISAITATP